jgi:hypothetical protein
MRTPDHQRANAGRRLKRLERLAEELKEWGYAVTAPAEPLESVYTKIKEEANPFRPATK